MQPLQRSMSVGGLVETIKAVIAGRPFPEAAFPGARAAR